jgi:phospholipid/cholesterol/gamma-HCH transport system permease protein
MRHQIQKALTARVVTVLEVDASGIERTDMSGLAVLHQLGRGAFTPGVLPTLNGLRRQLQTLLRAFPSEESLGQNRPPAHRISFPEEVGQATLAIVRDLGEQVSFLGAVLQALVAGVRRPRTLRWREIGIVFEKAAVGALPIVSLISSLTGIIIAFEAAQPLARFGAQIFVADLIGIMMIREFGPIFTAIILAGRSGSAFAAEIGTMKVNEELNALETMGLDPVRFLVVQRVIAGTVLMPLLTAYSMFMGVFGGVAVMQILGFPPARIWTQLSGAVDLSDLLVGIGKSIVFGTVVAALGCLRGMQTKSGPTAVGDSTTRAVVAGILMIIVIDTLFAVVAYELNL